MRTQLGVTTQGVRGGKNHHDQKGYALITYSESGSRLIELSVDTFEGYGKDYKMRETAVIDIYFPDSTGSLRFHGTVGELRQKLFGS